MTTYYGPWPKDLKIHSFAYFLAHWSSLESEKNCSNNDISVFTNNRVIRYIDKNNYIKTLECVGWSITFKNV